MLKPDDRMLEEQRLTRLRSQYDSSHCRYGPNWVVTRGRRRGSFGVEVDEICRRYSIDKIRRQDFETFHSKS